MPPNPRGRTQKSMMWCQVRTFSSRCRDRGDRDGGNGRRPRRAAPTEAAKIATKVAVAGTKRRPPRRGDDVGGNGRGRGQCGGDGGGE